MWTCPKCEAEVDDGFELCWACGTSPDGVEDSTFDPQTEGVLSDADYRQVQAAQTGRPPEHLVTVATFGFVHEAHVVRSQLAAEGITAYVPDEYAEGWELSRAGGGVAVQVSEKDVMRASQVLADLERGMHSQAEQPTAQDTDERIQMYRAAFAEDKNRFRENGEP
jgi:hypothetical protein